MPIRSRSLCAFTVLSAFLAPSALASIPLWTADETSDWTAQVWSAAEAGDSARLTTLLVNAPATTDPAAIARLRVRVDSLTRHRSESATANAAELQKRKTDIADHLSKDAVLDALVDAANIHQLTDDAEWKSLWASGTFNPLIEAGKKSVDAGIAAGDLLYVQELLFRMKGIAQDGADTVLQDSLSFELAEANKRTALVAKYAPRAMYDLRASVMHRLEPDREIEPYNELFAHEWKEAVSDVTSSLLLRSLKVAADSHITDSGWDPLISGGLESTRLVALTRQLGENFPQLKDEQRVAAFVSGIDRLVARNGNSFADARDVLVELASLNQDTIQLPPEVLTIEFGEGATASLSEDFGDDYSSIIWPEQLRRFRQQMEGDFVGVGVLIRYNDKREVSVVNPLEGSPAARAGVRPGDVIAGVNGQSTAGWSLNRAVEHITGPAGQPVQIELHRENTELPVMVELIRQSIPMHSVNGWWKKSLDMNGDPVWDWFLDRDAGIGYARVTSFNEDTVADFVAAVEAMRSEAPLNGVVIDLRGNPGGLLPAATGFVNLFVPRGPLVSVEDRFGKKQDEIFARSGQARFQGMPLVVLVNGESASASEIVSGALQAYRVATIVGDQSFGKGSVQTVQQVSDGRRSAAVKVTTQYYVLPPAPGKDRGRWVHKRAGREEWGVMPDLCVQLSPEQLKASGELRGFADFLDAGAMNTMTVDLRPVVNDLVDKGIDPQLELALMVLESRILTASASSRVAEHAPRAAPPAKGF
ncbi:MAG: S41 family peptidase [Planctomycetota bacterium]|nr:S41 family peptidase [Planctomycetota bacterium]